MGESTHFQLSQSLEWPGAGGVDRLYWCVGGWGWGREGGWKKAKLINVVVFCQMCGLRVRVRRRSLAQRAKSEISRHSRTHTHTHTHTHARTNARWHERTYARTHARIHFRTHACTHTHTLAYTREHTNTLVYTRVHTHRHARTHTHTHTHTHTLAYTHTHTHVRARMTANKRLSQRAHTVLNEIVCFHSESPRSASSFFHG